MTKALLIDVNYCTGCHTCEVACQNEHGFEPDRLGIEVRQVGPFVLNEEETRYQYDFFPYPTAFCDGCGRRVAKGKRPSCVQHCQAGCMQYGDVEELAPAIKGHKQLLITL